MMATEHPPTRPDSPTQHRSDWPMKYARIERERRYLLRSFPTGLAVRRRVEIHDRYVRGTALRLRKAQEGHEEPLRKLGQKVPLEGSTPPRIAHTTIYLTKAEYAALLSLPALELEKTRHIVDLDGATVAFDVFHGQLAGLLTAEIDLGEDAEDGETPVALGITPAAEITADNRFTGATLAATSATELKTLLGHYGIEI
jgi:CYTH domain-containing protein